MNLQIVRDFHCSPQNRTETPNRHRRTAPYLAQSLKRTGRHAQWSARNGGLQKGIAFAFLGVGFMNHFKDIITAHTDGLAIQQLLVRPGLVPQWLNHQASRY
jgi:hypothetical protein